MIYGVTWASGKLILFDKDQHCKFIKRGYTKVGYCILEGTMKSKSIKIENMHVFTSGLLLYTI